MNDMRSAVRRLTALCAGVAALAAVPAYAAPPAGYSLVWSDEFDSGVGSTPNTAFWSYDTGAGGWGNNELETYVNSQANCHVIADPNATDGEALQFEVQTDTSGNYYSARINTGGKAVLGPYGYIEYRSQLPGGNAQGMWPANWMLGENFGSVGWPACGEVDVMEEVNGQNINHGSLHAPNYNPTATISVAGLTSSYHTYAALWQPGSITFYVDGQAYETQTSSGAGGNWVFDNQTMFVLLNLAVGGNFPGSPNSSTQVPADMKVDYVRFYQYTGAPPVEAPFSGTAAAIPGTVQVENYDTGGQGLAYNVTSVNGSANSYRSDGVDLETTTDTGGGYDLGWTSAGQWFKYTVNAATAGMYTVTFRVSSGSATGTSGGSFHIQDANGNNLSGSVNVPGTGGWQTWENVTANVALPAGQQTLELSQDTGGYNVNYMTFAPAASAPPTPTGLTATSGNAQVALTWSASSGGTSYSVYRGTSPGGEGSTAIGSTSSLSYTDSAVTNGTTYYYKVAAINSVGASGLSNEASGTPAAPPPAVVQIDCGSSSAVAPFVADEDFNSGNEFSSTNAISTSGVSNAAPAAVYQTVRWNSSFTYTIPGLTAGQSYTVRLHFCELTWTAAGQRLFNVAINGTSYLSNFDIFATAGGQNKALVEQTTATANSSGQIVIAFTQGSADNPEVAGIEVLGSGGGSAPNAPAGLSASAGSGQVSLTWSASTGATSYNVYRGTTAGGESTTAIATGLTGTSYTNTGLTNGTTYYYKVAAVNSVGTSGLSNEASATPEPAVPAAPTGLNATAGSGQVSLSWTSSSGATSYNVYRGTSAGGEGTTAIATGITGVSYTNTGLTNGTTYYYKVAAVNSAGTSGLSNEASAAQASVPPAPIGLTATAGTGQVSLSWTGSIGATSYDVYRGTSSGGELTAAIATGQTATSYTDSTVTGGTIYYYKVSAVNSSGTSGLSNEASATPTAGLPDLIVTSISWTPTTLAIGSQVVFSCVVKNQGTAPTPAGVIVGAQFAIDGNESVITWSDTDTTSLAPGASVTLTANSGTNSVNYWPATAGTHTVQAWVNDVDRFNESNLNNNKLTATISVP